MASSRTNGRSLATISLNMWPTAEDRTRAAVTNLVNQVLDVLPLRTGDWPPPAALRGRPGSAVVVELHREVVVLALHQGDHFLQVVALLASHPQLVALDLDLDSLGSLVAVQLADLLGILL